MSKQVRPTRTMGAGLSGTSRFFRSTLVLPFGLLTLMVTGCEDEPIETPSPSPSEESPTPEGPTPTATPEGPTPTATPGTTTPTPTPIPCTDCDEDGVAATEDCDDTNPDIKPGAEEILCDTIDQDCDGRDGAETDALVCLDGSCVYDSIAQAINQADSGSTILVCPGEYDESNLTIDNGELSLKSVAGPEETIINANGRFQSVFRFTDAANTGLYGIEGFTLKGGRPTLYGGGLFVESASPRVKDCIIEQNTAGPLGAGVYLANSNASFENVIIRANASSDDAGGVYAFLGSPTFESCRIENNSAGDVGGGVSLDGSAATFQNTIFQSNSADNAGGAFELAAGSVVTIRNSLFVQNFSPDGAAIFMSSVDSDMKIYQSVFANNLGGTGLVRAAGKTAPTALPGAIVADIGSMTIQSSILAYNAGCNLSVTTAEVDISYSSVYNKEGGCVSNGITLPTSVSTAEPGFLSYAGATGGPTDYHLALASTLINKGAPDVLDVDGSVADPGIYGGPNGGDWDMDGDGKPGYFWPGVCENVPTDFDGTAYECNDNVAN